MATEINQVGSESPAATDRRHMDEKKDSIVQADAFSDIERNSDEESKRMALDRAEATELTPVEAFGWSVEGDQSPCTCPTETHMLITLIREVL